MLCRWGVPKALSVLAIYCVLLLGATLIALVVGPVLIEQFGKFAADVPDGYARARAFLQASTSAPLQLIGQRLPPFERLMQALTGAAPQWYAGAAGITATIVKIPVYFVTVLAIGFYWTIEVPRFERLLVSLLPIEQRPRALNIWHEIESKLGGFVRGQALAMLTVGAASAAGYALIGLPNAMALGVLAGVLEAVPLIGPALAAAPALLLALPLGGHTVLLVIGLAMLLQLIENNLLMPRIMQYAIGASALVNLLAVLAFGTLYGIVGILVAIPMTAVFHVLLDTLVINAEPIDEQRQSLSGNPWAALRVRVSALRQEARRRLRARTSRMGIDPATTDHVDDAVDQRIETAAARVERATLQAEEPSEPWTHEAQAAVVDDLHKATEEIVQAVKCVVDTVDSSPVHDPEIVVVSSRDGALAAEFVVGSQRVRRKHP
jgi:predicted PurR-regulated permease PerM